MSRNLRASTLLAVVALLSVPSIAAARTNRHSRIYFFTTPASVLDGNNPLVIKPRTIPLFLDGQWVLQNLRWKGWGSKVARATGISNSSSGNPNAAQGRRIKTRARVTLSHPGRFRGRRVYRCFALRVPPPATYPRKCIHHLGRAWLFARTMGIR